jgi:hypothetical protein
LHKKEEAWSNPKVGPGPDGLVRPLLDERDADADDPLDLAVEADLQRALVGPPRPAVGSVVEHAVGGLPLGEAVEATRAECVQDVEVLSVDVLPQAEDHGGLSELGRGGKNLLEKGSLWVRLEPPVAVAGSEGDGHEAEKESAHR